MQSIVCGRWNRFSSSREETRNLWSVKNKHDAQKASLGELLQAQDVVVKKLINELEDIGVDIIGDGGIRWDSIFDISRCIDGCSGFSQLTRIPDTNHFHRQPIANLPLSLRESLLLNDLNFLKRHTFKPLAMCLPGPYSLARQTQNVKEIGLWRLAHAYSEILNKEIGCLIDNGAEFVRIEEPQIIQHPEDFEDFKNLMGHLMNGADSSRATLATWFGDINKLSGYFDLPFGIFFVDFVDGLASIDSLKYFPSGKTLVAGIIDARHTFDFSDSTIRDLIARILNYVPSENLFISSSADLHFLPWDEAIKKAKRIVEISRWTISSSSINSQSNSEISRSLFSAGTAGQIKTDKVDKSAIARSNVLPDKSFITSAVGSYPQNPEMRKARAQLRKKEIDYSEYRKIIERNTKSWVDFQKSIGLDVCVSGEFFREDMAVYFGEQLDGRTLDFVPSYENRRYRPVEYYQAIKRDNFGGSETIEDYKLVQSMFPDCLLKETITGPATLSDWAILRFKDYYCDPLKFRLDLAGALRQQIEYLLRAGATILQIDEPALTTRMKNFPLDISAIRECISGLEDKVYLILHVCYSDMEALTKAFPDILTLPFHQIHMEMANRNFSHFNLIKEYGFRDKDIGLGVIDVHTDRIETVDEIISTVEKALCYFNPKQIWLTPDCGLKERSEEIAKAKLRVLIEAAKECRRRFGQ